MQDRLVISIADERGMRQFCVPKGMAKIIAIGAIVAVLVLSLSVLAMIFLMQQINDVIIQKNNAITSYHSVYQHNIMLQNAINLKSSELNVVNEKINKLERVINLKSTGLKNQSTQSVDLTSLSEKQKQFLLSLVPNGNPLENFEEMVSVSQRVHPLRKIIGYDGGMDYVVSHKTPVYATADGVVMLVQHNGKTGLGNLIKLTHSFGFFSMYAHLDSVVVKKGDIVQKGQLIGYSGDSGRSDGNRLYYEISFLDNMLNPLHYTEWNLDNFNAIFNQEDSIDWQNLVWAIEDVTKLQTFRVSTTAQGRKDL